MHEGAGDLKAENSTVGFFGGEKPAHYSHEAADVRDKGGICRYE